MAKGFVLTGQLLLQAPPAANTKQVLGDLRNQLKGIDVPINTIVNPQAQKRIKDVTSSIKTLGVAVDETSDHFRHFGEQSALATRRFLAFIVSTTGIIKFVNLLSESVSKSIAFQHEMVKIGQVTNRTVAGIADLANEVTKLSKSLGVNSTQLLNSAQILAQAGLSADDTRKSLEALAKTAVSPTFEDLISTTEGAVAIFSQFKISSEELEGALGSINAVAGKFAVESADIITAVRRTGGAFKAAGGDLNELAALFTSVRATTRESAESIATGFRTIFTRLQRSRTIDFLSKLGVQLRDTSNQFIGPYKAIERLSEALDSIPSTDPRFAQIIEELGGFRQISKVIPLIQEFGEAQKALTVAQLGQKSLAIDAARANESLAIQLAKVGENFDGLIRKITNSSSFKTFTGVVLKLADAFISVAESLEPILPVLGLVATLKLGQGVKAAIPGFTEKIFDAPGRRKNAGGVIHRFNSGGLVPGYGNSDTVPAMLTPGEFVIRKKAVKNIGLKKLAQANGFSDGGRADDINPFLLMSGDQLVRALKDPSYTKSQDANVKRQLRQAAQARLSKEDRMFPKWGTESARFDSLATRLEETGVGKSIRTANADVRSSRKPSFGVIVAKSDVNSKGISRVDENAYFTDDQNRKQYFKLHIGVLPQEAYENTKTFTREAFKDLIYSASLNLNNSLGAIPNENVKRLEKFIPNYESVFGSIFEGMIASIGAPYDDTESVENNLKRFDFPMGIGATLASKFGDAMLTSIPVEAKKSYTQYSRDDVRDKVKSFYQSYPEYFASGGMARGTDTVPAMLTPGEFVINKKAAQRIGYGKLNSANRTGRAYFAKGGKVGADTALSDLDDKEFKSLVNLSLKRFSHTFNVVLPEGIEKIIKRVTFKNPKQLGLYIPMHGNNDIKSQEIQLSSSNTFSKAIDTIAHEVTHLLDYSLMIGQKLKNNKYTNTKDLFKDIAPDTQGFFSDDFIKSDKKLSDAVAQSRKQLIEDLKVYGERAVTSGKYPADSPILASGLKDEYKYRSLPQEILARALQSIVYETVNEKSKKSPISPAGLQTIRTHDDLRDSEKIIAETFINAYKKMSGSITGFPLGVSSTLKKGKIINIDTSKVAGPLAIQKNNTPYVYSPYIPGGGKGKPPTPPVPPKTSDVPPLLGLPYYPKPLGYRPPKPPSKTTGLDVVRPFTDEAQYRARERNRRRPYVQIPALTQFIGNPKVFPSAPQSKVGVYGQPTYGPYLPSKKEYLEGTGISKENLRISDYQFRKSRGWKVSSTSLDRPLRQGRDDNSYYDWFNPSNNSGYIGQSKSVDKLTQSLAIVPKTFRALAKDVKQITSRRPIDTNVEGAAFIAGGVYSKPTSESIDKTYKDALKKVDANDAQAVENVVNWFNSVSRLVKNKPTLPPILSNPLISGSKVDTSDPEGIDFTESYKKTVTKGLLSQVQSATGKAPVNFSPIAGYLGGPVKPPRKPPSGGSYTMAYGPYEDDQYGFDPSKVGPIRIPPAGRSSNVPPSLPPLMYGIGDGKPFNPIEASAISSNAANYGIRSNALSQFTSPDKQSKLGKALSKIGLLPKSDMTATERAENRGKTSQNWALAAIAVSSVSSLLGEFGESLKSVTKAVTQASTTFFIFKQLSNEASNVRYSERRVGKIEKQVERAEKSKSKYDKIYKDLGNRRERTGPLAAVYSGYQGKTGKDLQDFLKTEESAIKAQFSDVETLAKKKTKLKAEGKGEKLTAAESGRIAAYRERVNVFQAASIASNNVRRADKLKGRISYIDEQLSKGLPTQDAARLQRERDILAARYEKRMNTANTISTALGDRGTAQIKRDAKAERRRKRIQSNLKTQEGLVARGKRFLNEAEYSGKITTGTDIIGSLSVAAGSYLQDRGLSDIKNNRDTSKYITGASLQGIGTGLATGAAAGSLAGPVGIAVGAALGAATVGTISYVNALEDAANKVREIDFDKTFKKFQKQINDIAEGNVNLYGNIGSALSKYRESFSVFQQASGDTRSNLRGELLNVTVPLETTFKRIIKDLAESGLDAGTINKKFTGIIGTDILEKLAVSTDTNLSEIGKEYSKKIEEAVVNEAKRKDFIKSGKVNDDYYTSLDAVTDSTNEFTSQLGRLKSTLAGLNSEVPDFSSLMSEVGDVSKLSPNNFSLLLNNARANSAFTGNFGNKILGNASQAYSASQLVPSYLKAAQAAGGLSGQGLDFNLKKMFEDAGFDNTIVNEINNIIYDIIGADLKPENLSKAILEDFNGTTKKFKDALAKLIEPMNMFTQIGFKIVEYQNGLYEQLKNVNDKILNLYNKDVDIRQQSFDKVAEVYGYSDIQKGRASDLFNRERLGNILGAAAPATATSSELGTALRITKSNIAALEQQKNFADPRITAQLNEEYIRRDRLIKGLEFLSDSVNTSAEAQAKYNTTLNAAKIRQDLVDTRVFGTTEDKFNQQQLLSNVRGLASNPDIESVVEDQRRGVESLLKNIGESIIPEITGNQTGNQLLRTLRYNSEYSTALNAGYDRNTAMQIATASANTNAAPDMQTALAEFLQAQGNALNSNQELVSSFTDDRNKFLTSITDSFTNFTNTLRSIFLEEENRKLSTQKGDLETALSENQKKSGFASQWVKYIQSMVPQGKVFGGEELNSLINDSKNIQEALTVTKEGKSLSSSSSFFQKLSSGETLESSSSLGASGVFQATGLGGLLNNSDLSLSRKLAASIYSGGNAWRLSTVNRTETAQGFKELSDNLYNQVLELVGDTEEGKAVASDVVSRFSGSLQSAGGGKKVGYTETFGAKAYDAVKLVLEERANKFKSSSDITRTAREKYGLSDDQLNSILVNKSFIELSKQFEGGTLSFQKLNDEATKLKTTLEGVNTQLTGNKQQQQQQPQNVGGGNIPLGFGAGAGAAGGQPLQQNKPKPKPFIGGQPLLPFSTAEKLQVYGLNMSNYGKDKANANGDYWYSTFPNGPSGDRVDLVSVIINGARIEKRLQRGGPVTGFGSGDKVPALLEPGEFVLNRNAVRANGLSNMYAMNRGTPRFQTGGLVGSPANSSGQLTVNSDSLNEAINKFSSASVSLTAALNAFPREITLTANHKVEIIVNGAQVLQNIMPEISNLVVEETKGQINKMLKTKFPQVGPM